MARFSRVVVGIGGSDRAGDALALARRLVDPGDGELILAWIDGDRSFRLPRPHGHSGNRSEAAFAAARDEIGGAVPVTEIRRSAASVARGLTETAEDTGADPPAGPGPRTPRRRRSGCRPRGRRPANGRRRCRRSPGSAAS